MVAPIERLIRFPSRLRRPRWTVRLRLTVLYGGLFLVAGAAILVITYVLVHHSTVRLGVQVRDGNFRIARVTTKRPPPYFQNEVGPAQGGQTIVSGPPPRLIQAAIDQQRATALHQLLVESGLALGVGTILSMALGWFVAGRVLRPLRTITGTVRTITAENLHERLEGVAGFVFELRGR